jgi:hypothetical protein
MNYWFDTDIWRDRVKESKFIYKMIDKTKDGKSYPNIRKIKEGDKVIFVNSLVCYADGIIKAIDFNPAYSGNTTAPYPVTIEYEKSKVWKRDVSLKEQDVINFLAKVPFKNSKYGTFLKDTTENTVKILPKRLASEFQRINKEIFDYLKLRGTRNLEIK